MFSKLTNVKLLDKYSPPWKLVNDTDIKVPSIYRLLYKHEPTEIHIDFRRNTRDGTLVSVNVFYKDYLAVFKFQNRGYFYAWVNLYHQGVEVATCDTSYEMTASLLRLFPKQLKSTFSSLLLTDNLPNKWNYIKGHVPNLAPKQGTSVKIPTVLKLELLQAGAYPLQIANTEKVTKTYYYFKD